MIKRVGTHYVSSSSDDNDIDMELSDLDNDKMDQELELKDIDKELELSSNKNLHKNEIGRKRAKLHRLQEKKKAKLVSLINSHTIHENDRLRKTRYINKQRTLVFASRGINQRMRHLMNDIKILIPHSKSEPKFDNKRDLSTIKEICGEHNCNNCIFFECRRNTDLYLWFSRCPNGPSMKFYVTSVHTMNELRLTGNCLNGSRPILIFDKKFDTEIQYKVMKELFMQIFGTPNGHPRSKPFVDRTMSFMILDNKVWVRNYQIVYNDKDNDDTNQNTMLVEIGPRFVLHPIRIIQGSFMGSTIYQDKHFINPNVERRAIKKQKRIKSAIHNNNYSNKLMRNIIKNERKATIHKAFKKFTNNPIDDVFGKGIDFQ